MTEKIGRAWHECWRYDEGTVANRPELRVSQGARDPLNCPASITYCFILRYRVL